MLFTRLSRIGIAVAMSLGLAGCGGGFSGIGGDPAPAQTAAVDPYQTAVPASSNAGQRQIDAMVAASANPDHAEMYYSPNRSDNTIWGLFGSKSSNTTVEVNKYIWNAALDVLNFLPIESVDPFTGVIVTGYGTVPGSNQSYRATVYVNDPALDARSLKLSMQTRGGGAVSPETLKAVEDAILSRARQLRIADTKL